MSKFPLNQMIPSEAIWIEAAMRHETVITRLRLMTLERNRHKSNERCVSQASWIFISYMNNCSIKMWDRFDFRDWHLILPPYAVKRAKTTKPKRINEEHDHFSVASIDFTMNSFLFEFIWLFFCECVWWKTQSAFSESMLVIDICFKVKHGKRQLK